LVSDAQDWTFAEFHDVPWADRGEAWEMARQIRVAVAQRQAVLEAGVIRDAMARGASLGRASRPLVDDIDIDDLKANNRFKDMIKARRAQGVENGSMARD